MGWGSSTWRGWGPKSSVCPSKPRETKLFDGISRDFWRDISGAPEKYLKKCVQFLDPKRATASKTQNVKVAQNRFWGWPPWNWFNLGRSRVFLTYFRGMPLLSHFWAILILIFGDCEGCGSFSALFEKNKACVQFSSPSWAPNGSCRIMWNHGRSCKIMRLKMPAGAWFCWKMPDFVLWEWLKVPDGQKAQEPRNINVFSMIPSGTKLLLTKNYSDIIIYVKITNFTRSSLKKPLFPGDFESGKMLLKLHEQQFSGNSFRNTLVSEGKQARGNAKQSTDSAGKQGCVSRM